jgi:adenylyltransferase/sulfurtransferase
MSGLSKEELVRYSRQMILPEVKKEGQLKLKQAKVLVVGAGGLGCPALQYLNAAGVGTIGIIDFDRVEVHNLQRQILYSDADIGKPKVECAIAKLSQMNPFTVFIPHVEMLTEENAERIIRDFDVVVDGSDNFLTRYLVNDTCVKWNKTLVYGSIFGWEGQLTVFNYSNSKNLRDIYPQAPDPEDVPNCDENGVMGVVPGIIGNFMALKTIEVLLGTFSSRDKLHIFDLKNGSMRSVSF